MSKPPTEAKLRRAVKTRPLWEVTCEIEPCNGNADEGEIYDSRSEAEDMRENHIRLHLQGAFEPGEYD